VAERTDADDPRVSRQRHPDRVDLHVAVAVPPGGADLLVRFLAAIPRRTVVHCWICLPGRVLRLAAHAGSRARGGQTRVTAAGPRAGDAAMAPDHGRKGSTVGRLSLAGTAPDVTSAESGQRDGGGVEAAARRSPNAEDS